MVVNTVMFTLALSVYVLLAPNTPTSVHSIASFSSFSNFSCDSALYFDIGFRNWSSLVRDCRSSFEHIQVIAPAIFNVEVPHEVLPFPKSMPAQSSPTDYIPPSLLLSCSNVFSEIVSHLANLPFCHACFPSSFKVPEVTPRIKKPGSDKDAPSNDFTSL